MSVTVTSVFENTFAEVSHNIDRDDWNALLVKVYDHEGIKGLTVLENNITMLSDTRNDECMCEYIETLMDQYEV